MSKHGGKDIREKHRHVNRYADKSQADRAIGSTQPSGPVDVDALLHSIREADMKSRRKQAASFGSGHSSADRRPQPDPLVSASYLQDPANMAQSSQPTEPTITSPKTTPTDPRLEGPMDVKPSATPKTYAQQIREEIKELVEQLSYDSHRLDALSNLKNHIISGSYDTRQIVLEMMREIIGEFEARQFSDEMGRGYLVLHLAELYRTLAQRNLLFEPVDIEAMLRLRTIQLPATSYETLFHITLNLNIAEGLCARHQTVGPILAKLKRPKFAVAKPADVVVSTTPADRAVTPIPERRSNLSGVQGESPGRERLEVTDSSLARGPLTGSQSTSNSIISDPSNNSELKTRIDGLIEQLAGYTHMKAVDTLQNMIGQTDRQTTDAIRAAFREKVGQLGTKDKLTHAENLIAYGIVNLYLNLADLDFFGSNDVMALRTLQKVKVSDPGLMEVLVNKVTRKLSERVLNGF